MTSNTCLWPQRIDEQGWLYPVIRCPSPNFNQRPPGAQVSLLVVHNISLPPAQFGGDYVEAFFCNRLDAKAHPYFATIAALHVSAHCLIKRSGELIQFVSFVDRAWHAGQSCFEGVTNCNDFSVGIELEGTDSLPYTEAQYLSLLHVSRLLLKAYPAITLERIVGHSDVSPGRKTDPGDAFDWRRYREQLTREVDA